MSKKNYIIPIFVPHKGCPHDCIFCNQKRITGQIQELSSKDIDNIISQYIRTINKPDVNIEVAFFGGSFTAIPREEQDMYLSVANRYLEMGKIDSIRLSTRPDYINKEILKNLKKFGVSIVELGVQSMDEEVLHACQRGHNTEDVINAVNLLKEEGFTVGIQLMVGLPKDNEEKCIKTVKKVVKLKPHIARIYPSLVIKDTYMENIFNSGRYVPLKLKEAVNICKLMLIHLERNGINVIRIGLQPTDDMQIGKSIVAGPYHPAFRQLVESEIYKDMIDKILESIIIEPNASVIINFNSKDYSDIVGQKKSNIEYFRTKYSAVEISFIASDSVDSGCIIANIGESRLILSKKDYYRNISL